MIAYPYSARASLFTAPLFLLALVLALQFNGGKHYYWMAFALTPLLVLTQLASNTRGTTLQIHKVAVLILTAYIGWAFLSLFWSVVPFSSALASLLYAFCLSAVFVGIRLTEEGVHKLTVGLMLLGVGLAVLTTYQRFTLGIPTPSGTLLNWNSHAGLLTMLVLPSTADYLRNHGRHALATGAAILCISFAIALTQSRGAVIALAMGTTVVILFALRNSCPKSRIVRLLCVLGTALIVGSLLPEGGQLFERMYNTISSPSPLSGRAAIWEATWQMYLTHPIAGWGVGTFWTVYPQFRHPFDSSGGQNAHNDYLQALSETGPIGFILLLGFVLSVIWVAWRLYRSSEYKAGGFAAATIAIFSQSFVTSNLSQPSILMVLGVYIGILLRLEQRKRHSKGREQTSGHQQFHLVQGIVAGILMVWAGLAAWSEHLCQTVGEEKNAEHAIQRLELAKRIYPFWDFTYLSVVDQVTNMLSENKALPVAQRAALVNYGKEQLAAAKLRFPIRSSTHLREAFLLQAAGAPAQDIENCFELALKYEPFDLVTRVLFADYLINNGKSTFAADVLEKGWNRYYHGHFGYAITYLKRLEKARRSIGNIQGANAAHTFLDELKLRIRNNSVKTGDVFFK